MHKQLLSLVCLLSLAFECLSQKYAYVSVLSSNDFLIPAKVLAYRLKKLNAAIPYIIIVTEDITLSSRKQLEQHGVIVHIDSKIDTPYINTHKARKYQYTKIKLWKMTEFDVIVHLDLDVLPTRDISTLFQCGTFCASFRHSDMFNSGVFVLKTNETIFADMAQKVKSAVSYDGGDQGFLNTYFHDLKYSPMYNDVEPTKTGNNCSFSQMRSLSSKFNYDIGMYYLNNGRYLVDPAIIHYTMGPTKPWLWWTYPLFDLNWVWLTARREMEMGTNDKNYANVELTIKLLLYISFLLFFYYITGKKTSNKSFESMSKMESHLIPHALYIFSVYFSINIASPSALPVPAWIFFSSNFAWSFTLLTTIYSHLRVKSILSFKSVLSCVFAIILGQAVFWLILAQITHFNTRVILAVLFIVVHQISIVYFVRHVIIINSLNRYQNYKVLQNDHHSV